MPILGLNSPHVRPYPAVEDANGSAVLQLLGRHPTVNAGGSDCRYEADHCPSGNPQGTPFTCPSFRGIGSPAALVGGSAHRPPKSLVADPAHSPLWHPEGPTISLRSGCAQDPRNQGAQLRVPRAGWQRTANANATPNIPPACNWAEPICGRNACGLPHSFNCKLPHSVNGVFSPAQSLISKRRENHVFWTKFSSAPLLVRSGNDCPWFMVAGG